MPTRECQQDRQLLPQHRFPLILEPPPPQRSPHIEPNLIEANLSEADLSEMELSGTNLMGADLSTASLTQEALEPATGDQNTQLPPDLKPPAHWGVKPDEQARED